MNLSMSTTLSVYYYFWLPVIGQVRWSHSLDGYSYLSDADGDWLSGTRDGICIPIPAEMALTLKWVTQEEIVDNYDLPEHVRTALRLIGTK